MMLSLMSGMLRRRRRAATVDSDMISSASEDDSERVGNARRKMRRRRCRHDPLAQAFAEVIVSTWDRWTAPVEVIPPVGNGLGGGTWSRLCTSPRRLFIVILLYRLLSTFMVQTYFVPDEYWQSLEVAHNTTFGYGYLTWEWREGIRGFLYPGAIAFVYKVASMVALDGHFVIVTLPRLLQSALSAVGDFHLYKLSLTLAGPLVAEWSLIYQLSSWFTYYCATRTLTNSAEASLTVIALSWYPWKTKQLSCVSSVHYLWMAGLSTLIRPTAAITWVPLAITHLSRTKGRQLFWLSLVTGGIGLFLGMMSLRIDKTFYGQWVVIPMEFLRFNVLHNLSAFYGTHPWHWYITQGLPFALGTHTIPLVLSLQRAKDRHIQLLLLWMVFVYSFIPHKEARFLLPALPLTAHLCGYWTVCLQQKLITEEQLGQSKKSDLDSQPESLSGESTDGNHGNEGESKPQSNENSSSGGGKQRSSTKRPQGVKVWIFLALFVSNVPQMMYFGLVHQRGAMDVMGFLRKEAAMRSDPRSMSVLFLTPCHSTPYYSHIHLPIKMRFLTCEPNLQHQSNYTDEAEVFYSRPRQWIKENLLNKKKKSQLPTHLVAFSTLEPPLLSFLNGKRYTRCVTFFHTHFPSDRVGNRISVYCRRKPLKSADKVEIPAQIHS